MEVFAAAVGNRLLKGERDFRGRDETVVKRCSKNRGKGFKTEPKERNSGALEKGTKKCKSEAKPLGAPSPWSGRKDFLPERWKSFSFLLLSVKWGRENRRKPFLNEKY